MLEVCARVCVRKSRACHYVCMGRDGGKERTEWWSHHHASAFNIHDVLDRNFCTGGSTQVLLFTPQCLQLRKSTWAVEIRSCFFFFYLMFVPHRRKLCLILTQRRRHNNNKIRFHTLLKPHNGLLQSETMAWAGVSNVRATRNGIPGGQSVFQLQSDFKWGSSCLMNNILHSFAFIVH